MSAQKKKEERNQKRCKLQKIYAYSIIACDKNKRNTTGAELGLFQQQLQWLIGS